jgi:SAM-dependent methyltransferase
VIPRAAQSLRLRAADAADAALGRRDGLTPPRRLSGYVGDSDFRATGEEFLGHFRQIAGLRPSDHVLEIGCGIGRMARVLVPVLRPPGSYDGFDVVRSGIDWCADRYRHTPAPFCFHHADLRNSAYNPNGTSAPDEYRFPFPDETFDLVLATSLFTHLLAGAADRYQSEAARVLAGGGRLFTTWLLLSDHQRAAPPPPFRRTGGSGGSGGSGGEAVRDLAVPEAAVAYDEAWLRERLTAHALVLDAIHRGTWSGRPGPSRQDLVLAHHPPRPARSAPSSSAPSTRSRRHTATP